MRTCIKRISDLGTYYLHAPPGSPCWNRQWAFPHRGRDIDHEYSLRTTQRDRALRSRHPELGQDFPFSFSPLAPGLPDLIHVVQSGLDLHPCWSPVFTGRAGRLRDYANRGRVLRITLHQRGDHRPRQFLEMENTTFHYAHLPGIHKLASPGAAVDRTIRRGPRVSARVFMGCHLRRQAGADCWFLSAPPVGRCKRLSALEAILALALLVPVSSAGEKS